MKTFTFKYMGRIYKNCAPSAAQQQALASDTSWQNTVKSSYSTEFGDASSIFTSLSAGLGAIITAVSAYSAPVLASMNAQTLNAAAANAVKVNALIGRNAAKGSATPGVESGITQAEQAESGTEILSTAANEQAEITQKNAQLAIQERDKAIQMEENLPNVFDASNKLAGEETTAEQATSSQANTNAQESRSWVGMLGGLADAAVGGLTKGLTGSLLGGGVGGGGGSTPNNYSSANSVGTWNGGPPGGESGMSNVSEGAFGEGSSSWVNPTP
jgi:hypothetical protein